MGNSMWKLKEKKEEILEHFIRTSNHFSAKKEPPFNPPNKTMTVSCIIV